MSAAKMIILEDDRDLAETYREIAAILLNREAVISHSLRELCHQEAVLASCDLAILDIDLGDGEPTGIDAYHWLREHGLKGRIFFMTGHAKSNPLVAQAAAIGGVRVLAKPLSIDRLIATLGEEERRR